MFNTAFNDIIPADKAAIDLYPAKLRSEIDCINEWVYDAINSKFSLMQSASIQSDYDEDGVYKAGFASSAEAYEAAVYPLFESLDKIEKILSGKDYLVGDELTEADIRLWVTIVGTFTLGSLAHDQQYSRSASIPCTCATLSAILGIFVTGIPPSTCKCSPLPSSI